VLTVGLRHLGPQVLGARVAAIAHVKGTEVISGKSNTVV
jgi:hypothetical protein